MSTSERLSIKAFAGIEAATIDVARITALIGPQASGKSVTAKLLYFFRGIWQTLYYAVDADLDADTRKDHLKDQFRKFFPPETWGAGIFTIQYEFGHHKVLLRRAPSSGKPSDGLILYLPSFFDDLLEKLNSYAMEAIAKSSNPSFGYGRYEAWRRLEPEIKQLVGDSFFSSQLFVPAGRAFFSNIENNVFAFISRSEEKLDPFLTEFGQYFSWAKQGGIRRTAKREYSTPLSNGLLGGPFVIEKNKEYIKTTDGRSLPLSKLSSGQQEALPLLMMLESVDDELRLGRGSAESRHASYIEEPEAHLFPDFQRRITEKIVEYALARDGAQSVFLTTHSPYVLSTINTLLLAGRLGKSGGRSQQKKVVELVPSTQWLPENSVAVYSFDRRSCESVMDIESGLIDATYLDSVSTSISQRFDALLAIEYPSSEVASE